VLAVAPSSPAAGAVKAGYGVASVGGTNARTLSNVEVIGLLKAAVATLGSSPLVVEFMLPAGGSSSPAVAAPPPLLPPTPALVAPAAAAAPAPSSSVSVTFKAAPFGLSLHDKDAAAAAATGCAVTLLAVAPSSPAVGAVKAGYGVASVGGTNARTLSNVEVMGLLKAAVATLGSSPLVVEFMPQAPTPSLLTPATKSAAAGADEDGEDEDDDEDDDEEDDEGEEDEEGDAPPSNAPPPDFAAVAAKFGGQPGSWTCTACLVPNPPAAARCACCDAANPANPAAAAPVAAPWPPRQ
jgi:hypothetical protein